MISGVQAAGAAVLRQAAALRGASRLSVLIFHRVSPEPDPLFPNEVDAARFDRMMGLLARAFRVLPLDRAVQLLQQGRLPSPAMAITFDDGYADNHDIALPILQRHGLSASFFVATGFLDGGRMWNDTIIECVRRCRKPRVALDFLALPPTDCETWEQRRALIERVIGIVKYKLPAEREPLLQALHEACGRPSLPQGLMMRSAQVSALRQAGMLIGAHTVHHPILCTLDDDTARHEMAASRQRLQTLTDDAVDLFAYPNGRLGRDYDERHVRLARELGFAAAVATNPGVTRTGEDLFQIRRFTPWHPSPARWISELALNHLG